MKYRQTRRQFLKATGLGAASIVMPRLALGEQTSAKYGADITKRLNDPRLFARGRTRVYSSEHLTAISFPVGGIGAGCIQINGKAERHVWQIFNNFSQAHIPHSFLDYQGRLPIFLSDKLVG